MAEVLAGSSFRNQARDHQRRILLLDAKVNHLMVDQAQETSKATGGSRITTRVKGRTSNELLWEALANNKVEQISNQAIAHVDQ